MNSGRWQLQLVRTETFQLDATTLMGVRDHGHNLILVFYPADWSPVCGSEPELSDRDWSLGPPQAPVTVLE